MSGYITAKEYWAIYEAIAAFDAVIDDGMAEVEYIERAQFAKQILTKLIWKSEKPKKEFEYGTQDSGT